MTVHVCQTPYARQLFQRIKAHAVLLGTICLLSGCTMLLPNPGQPPTRYTLSYLTETTQPGVTSHDALPRQNLRIDLPTVYSPLDTQRIALTPVDQTIDYIADAEWANRLPLLLQEALMISCQNRLPAFCTLRTTRGMLPDYVLTLDVRKFHIHQREDTIAILEYFVQIIRTSDRMIVAQRVIHDSEPLHAFNRAYMAQALDTLNQRALETTVGMIQKHALTATKHERR